MPSEEEANVIFMPPVQSLFSLSDLQITNFVHFQNWFAARLTKWRKEEGFVPIAERTAILAQNMNKKAK